MAKTLQLLKLVRNAVASVNRTTDNPEFKAVLTPADVAIALLQIQDTPDFYLRHIDQGKVLLEEGRKLALEQGANPGEPAVLRPDVHGDLRIEALEAEIDKLHEGLVAVVSALDERRSPEEKAYLIRLSDWETGLYNHCVEQGGGAAKDASRQITREALQAYLERRFPHWRNLKVTNFVSLDGGFSKKTILFETDDAVNGAQAMVIRAEQAIDLLCYEGSDVTQEFYTIQLMQKAGLPIAEPLWLEADRSHLGVRFIVSRRAEGKTYGGNLGSNEALSPELVRSILGTFIKMHNIKLDAEDPLARQSHLKEWLPYRNSLRDATHHHVIEFLPRVMRLTGIPASPQLIRALRWLEHNIPDTGDEAPTILHIDFALNNLIIKDDRIGAVLDWESSRLGDPAEDITWTQQNLAAYIDMPEFLRLYKEGTGREISAYRLAYSRVAKCALNAITCIHAVRLLDENDAAPINLAPLGYQYLAWFGSQFNPLIEAAEALR